MLPEDLGLLFSTWNPNSDSSGSDDLFRSLRAPRTHMVQTYLGGYPTHIIVLKCPALANIQLAPKLMLMLMFNSYYGNRSQI